MLNKMTKPGVSVHFNLLIHLLSSATFSYPKPAGPLRCWTCASKGSWLQSTLLVPDVRTCCYSLLRGNHNLVPGFFGHLKTLHGSFLDQIQKFQFEDAENPEDSRRIPWSRPAEVISVRLLHQPIRCKLSNSYIKTNSDCA